MNNRINGDFDTTTLEAFRAAYASREITPEDLEVDQYTGLPTDTVTNISPWIAHTGLWKANPGTDRAFIPNQPLDLANEVDEDELSEDEFNRMVDEVLTDLEEEERFADRIFNSDDDDDEGGDDEREEEDIEDLINRLLYNDEGEEEELEALEDDEGGEESMEDDELEALIAEILAEAESEDDGESEETEEGEATEDDIEALINEIMAEIDEEAPEDSSDGSIGEVSNDELEEMIGELEPDGSLEDLLEAEESE